MALYAIGDVQGCFDELQRLLKRIQFQADRDQLWFVGDLVNRGPGSLEVLRLVKSLGSRAITVLGNHDLHLLAVAAGVRPPAPRDTLQAVLDAPDREALLGWLRHRPLLHHDTTTGHTLIHAGLPPQWDLAQSQSCARELERVLRSAQYPQFLRHMYGDRPACWSPGLEGWERLRFISNCFTRLRYCRPDGSLVLAEKGAPGQQRGGCLPWFALPRRASAAMKIVFGHWSTLGRHSQPGIYALDSGCVWGGALTALRLGDDAWYEISCEGACRPDNKPG